MGGELRVEDVKNERGEEVGYIVKRGIWSERSVEECWRVTGKEPMSVRWVDTNKGTKEKPDVRSRMVGRDFKGGKGRDEDELFASTPPLEALRMLMSKAASTRKNKRRMRKMLFIDAKKANLNPLCHEDVYIVLPEEVGAGPGRCGKLVHWLYGCRPAAQAWETFYSEKMEGVGFERGRGSAVVFHHKEKDISALLHGDDFVFVGDDEELTWIQELVKSWFEVKIRGRLSREKEM